MSITIALAGNPNCGKTTLFNALTGSNQYVGNWPGVTVEKKEGKLKKHKDIVLQDLPGIYSLSPYTLEEVVARNYLIEERPDAIINVVDGTNIERNLYLTTQLIELGIPMVIAVNMIDLVRKNGDQLNLKKLGEALGCPVVEISALKNEGMDKVAETAMELAKKKAPRKDFRIFTGEVEQAIDQIEKLIVHKVQKENLYWYAIKVFERDEKILEKLALDDGVQKQAEAYIENCEKKLDDDSESMIANQRYVYIGKIVASSVKKKLARGNLSTSDKIDTIVTNRFLALPIFVVVMSVVYYIAIGTVGDWLTGWTNDVLFSEYICGNLGEWMESIGCAAWLTGLVVDGIVGGVGAVIGFVPQMLVLFLMLSALEDIGYMARVAFIMDRIFRKFGLSGKSFIPMLIGSGCGVPGVMASRTIESDRDRKMTIMTTCFIPCGAKMPIIALFAGAIFGGSGLVAVSAYFIGVAAIIISGIILKKTKLFAGEPAPFVMELPAYHIPAIGNVLRATWERGWSFIKRAGTIILASSIVLWFLQGFGYVDGSLVMVEDNNTSLLASIGSVVAFIFAPLGFGSWQGAVATFTGLIAKENVVSTFGVLYGFAEVAEDGVEIWSLLAADFTALTAYSFMVFNLLCAPCFAAMGAIRREMNNAKWTWIAIGWMCGLAYVVSLMIYQFGMLANGVFGVGTVAAFLCLIGLLYFLFRRNAYETAQEPTIKQQNVKLEA